MQNPSYCLFVAVSALKELSFMVFMKFVCKIVPSSLAEECG